MFISVASELNANSSQAQFELSIARSRLELEEAFRLAYLSYTRTGLQTANTIGMRLVPHHFLPTTDVMVAVAVDKTPARTADAALSSQQVPNLMPYGQSANAIFGFPATATNATWLRMNGLLWLLPGLALLVFSRVDSHRRYAKAD